MFEFLDHLDPLLKAFWYIALPSSAIFLIQTVLTFLGSDATDGNAADFSGDLQHTEAPFQLFSFRNLINFCLGFGWAGITFSRYISNTAILIGVAFAVGVSFILVFFYIIKQLMKLSEDNSFKITSTLNKPGDVYLTIPPKRSGKGKVQISVKGAFHELDAMTDEKEAISSGSVVKIVDIDSDILIVKKF